MKKLFLVTASVICGYLTYGQVPDSTIIKTDTVPPQQAPPPPPPPPATTQPATPPPAPAPAQPQPADKPKRSFNEKFALGFGTGFWITPGETYVEIAPTLAYRFPKILITGLGFRYIYRHDRYLNNDLHTYGPLLFARANLTKRIYLWTEYEYLFSQYFDDSYKGDSYSRETGETDSWFAGIGYQRSVGKRGRGGISVQFLYNFLYDRDDRYNPYYSAYTYRVGYFF